MNSQRTKEFVRDRERKLGWNQWKGTEKSVRDREKFEIEGLRDRESLPYINLRKLALRGHLNTNAQAIDRTRNFLLTKTIP